MIKENITLFLRWCTTKDGLTFILSLIGALAWFSPLLYDYMQKPQLDARLLGLMWTQDMKYENYNLFNNSNITLQGIGYFPNIAIISLKKNFNIKHVEVLIKYPSEMKLRNGDIFYSTQYNFSLNVEGKRVLKIPVSEHINSLVVLENGKPVSVFVPFIVNKSVYENFEFIELRFYEFDGSIQIIKLYRKDLDVNVMYFEDKYWE